MGWGTDLKNALTFHGDAGMFKNEQKWSDMPGSPVSLMHAISMDKLNSPYGAERNSFDEFAGGGSSSQPVARDIGRAVGTYFTPGAGIGKGIYGMTQPQPGQPTQSSSAPSNIFQAAPSLAGGSTQSPMSGIMATNPNLYNANAQQLADQGRNGDKHLLHITDDELKQLQSTGKITQNPDTGLPEAFGLSDLTGGSGGGSGVLGPIGQLIGQNQNRQDLTGLANQASNASNPLTAPQRGQYQDQLSNMFTQGGAQNFMNTDPSVQAQKQMIGDQMTASFGKSGNMPLTGIMGSAQLANAFGQQYDQRIGELTTLGGFNQGNPYGGMPYSSLMPLANQGNSANMGAIGSMMPMLGNGLNSMFGSGGATPLSQLNGMGNMSLSDPAYG